MRWSAEERLRRALPYGMWKWNDDDGVITETIFNRHYRALATRVDGQLVMPTRDPPRPLWRAAEYYYGDGTNTPMNGFPWRDRAARVAAEKVLIDWGIDPVVAVAVTAAAIREELRRERSGYGRASDEELIELIASAEHAPRSKAIIAACRAELVARGNASTVIAFRRRS